MTRITGARIAFVVLLLALAVPTFVLIRWLDDPRYTVFVIVALLVPGRVQGVLLRDLFRGRRQLEQGDAEASIASTTRFLGQLDRRPWLRHAVWLAWSTYTHQLRAMALNNLGTAHLRSGRVDEAERWFDQALALDPLYPLPWFNRAIIAQVREDPDRASAAFAEARRLGFTGGSLDQLTQKAGDLLANIEGR